MELLMAQGSDQGILHLDHGCFVFGNVSMHVFPRAAALEHASLALRFLSRGNRRLLSSEANHRVIISVWMAATFSQRSASARGTSSMNRSFSCAWWRMRVKYSSLCDGATSGRGSLLVPSSNPRVARQGERYHDDVIKWKHFPRNWPFVWGIHRSPVNSPHKGQWRRALMFSLICVGINDWVNNREAGDLRCYRAHYDVIVMGPGWFCHGTFQPVLPDPWLSSML